jgi:hypothetical protein
MITSLRRELLQRLVELSSLYPEMRFGQLICFACLIAGEDAPGLVREAEDEAVLEAVKRHITQRTRQLGEEAKRDSSTLTPTHTQLLQVFEKLGDQYPEWSTGQLVFKLAALAHANVYDIQDEELLEAAKSDDPGLQWFKGYSNKFEGESTFPVRPHEPAHRCPCCSYRTLYERGSFEICPVCYWEDDGQDNADAGTVRGGPNGSLSLSQARANYGKYGVYDPKYTEHVRPPRSVEM